MGPLVAAALVMNFNYEIGFVAIGAAVAVCGAAFLMATSRDPKVALATA